MDKLLEVKNLKLYYHTSKGAVRALDDVSFDAARHEGQTVRIDDAYVDARLAALSQDEDLSRFIL